MSLNVHIVESVAQPCAYECFNINPTIDWATPIRDFIETGNEPHDEAKAKRIRHLAPSYIIVDEILYKKCFSTHLLGCIAPPETTSTLRELHEGYAACHEEAIIKKAFNQGYC